MTTAMDELKQEYGALCAAYGDAQLKYKALNKFIGEIEEKLAALEVKAREVAPVET